MIHLLPLILAQYVCLWGQPCQPSSIITGPEQASVLVLYGDSTDAGFPTITSFGPTVSTSFVADGGDPAFTCTGRCNLTSEPGHSIHVDTGDNTQPVGIGDTNTNAVNIGNAGSTTTITGNLNLGTTTTGTWVVYKNAALVAATSYGTFSVAGTVSNTHFGKVSSNIETTGVAGGSNNYTVTIRDITTSTDICTSGNQVCNQTINTPTNVMTCNHSITTGDFYAIRVAAVSGGCGTYPAAVTWTIELTN